MALKAGISLIALAALGALVACEKSSSDATEASRTASTPCDPLAVETKPTALRAVLAAGRAPDGTLYVIDHAGPRADIVTQERLFESNGNVLQRVAVLGTGSGPDFFMADFAEGQVRVELQNGVPTRMGLKLGTERDPKNKSFDISTAQELTLVSADAYGSLAVADLSDVYVLYDAVTPDKHRFIAFHTTIDAAAHPVRVFYGTDDRLVERRVLADNRSSSVDLTFDLDGVVTRAHLRFNSPIDIGGPSQLDPPGTPLEPVEGSPGYGAPHQPSFEPDAAPPPVIVQKSPAELTAGLTFICF